jgi:hypothetical protein
MGSSQDDEKKISVADNVRDMTKQLFEPEHLLAFEHYVGFIDVDNEKRCINILPAWTIFQDDFENLLEINIIIPKYLVEVIEIYSAKRD